MRVAFLSNSNSIHLKEWAEHFASVLGHDVLVLTIQKPELPYSHVRVVHIGGALTSPKVGWFSTIPRIETELRRFKADLLVAYRIVSYGFVATLTGFRPVVLAAQREGLVERDTMLSRFCVRHAVRRADLINAWSTNIRDSLLRFGAPPERVFTCSRGVDLDLFPAVPLKPDRPLRIVMTRSLRPTYNVGQLVEAMPHVLRSVPDAVCEIAGDGPEREPLERIVERLGVRDSVRFKGRLDRQGIVSMLQDAQVYVSTSVTDGLALSHFEAMAAGLFPIVSDISANRLWIRDGENGFLAPLGQPEVLAERILEAWRDRGRRETVAAENRRLVEQQFDRRRNLLRISQAYEQLVARYRNDPGRVASPLSSIGE